MAIMLGVRYKMGRNFIINHEISSDDILESLYKLRIRESEQLKTVLEVYDMKIHQKISMPQLSEIENDGEEEYRSETSISKL